MCMYLLRDLLPNFTDVYLFMFLLTLQEGDTPLCVACNNGHKTVVKLLLGSGSDVRKRGYVSLNLMVSGST